MSELEPGAIDREESGPLGGVERGPAVDESARRGEDDSEVLRLVRGSDHEETLSRVGEPSDALEEDALNLPGERQRVRKRLDARELSLGERGWELDQRECVPVSLFDQAVKHRWGDVDTRSTCQKGRGGFVVERLDSE